MLIPEGGERSQAVTEGKSGGLWASFKILGRKSRDTRHKDLEESEPGGDKERAQQRTERLTRMSRMIGCAQINLSQDYCDVKGSDLS